MANENFLTLLEKEKPSIQAMLPNSEDRDRWWALAYEMTKRPDLREVAEKNPISLINALKKFADWGLIPDGEEGFINVYGGEAAPERMWKGYIRCGVEAGAIAHAVADVIREGDTFEESVGPQGRQIKVARLHGKKGRKIVGGYAMFWLPNGLMDYELFEEDDIEAVKAAAKRMAERKKPGAGLSPAWRFFEGEQVKKSVIKRGMKRMRGNRNTEAGQRFAAMMAEKSAFDVEVSAATLPPDDLPAGENLVTAAPATAPAPAHKPLTLVADSENRPINDAEENEIVQEIAKKKGVKLWDAMDLIRETIMTEQFGRLDDLKALRVNQITQLLEAIE